MIVNIQKTKFIILLGTRPITARILPAFPNTITSFLEYYGNGEMIDSSNDCLKKEINRAEAWFWRSRAQIILDLKTSLGNDRKKIDELPIGLKQGSCVLELVMRNIEEAIKVGTIRGVEEGLVESSVDDDFGVFGKAYKDLGKLSKSCLDDHDIRDLNSIAESRLATLAWLVGRQEWEYEPGELKFINPMGSLWSPE
jgi:hypothetical protein